MSLFIGDFRRVNFHQTIATRVRHVQIFDFNSLLRRKLFNALLVLVGDRHETLWSLDGPGQVTVVEGHKKRVD